MELDNLTFHNIREIKRNDDNSYSLFRIPEKYESFMNDQTKNMNHSTTGVEIRFFLISDEVTLYVKGRFAPTRAYVYFGNVQGEWFQSSYEIPCGIETEIKVKKPSVLDSLEEMNKMKKSIFPFDLVRIIFDGGGNEINYIRKAGETKPYKEDNKVMLAYGSSITSNSIVFNPEISYISRLAHFLGCDLVNLGYSGSCEILPFMADFLSEQSFDICHLELGINIISAIDENEFEKRCSYLFEKLIPSHESAQFYVTDIFSYFNDKNGVSDEKLENFRNIIKNLCLKYSHKYKLIYVPGNKLLTSRANLCLDLVHPDMFGHMEIFENYKKILK